MGSTSGTTGADLVGIDATNVVTSSSTNLQTVIEETSLYPRNEQLTISVLNTIPDMTYTPKDSARIKLYVDGVKQDYTSDYTVDSKSISWVSGDFNLDPGDNVWVEYCSID